MLNSRFHYISHRLIKYFQPTQCFTFYNLPNVINSRHYSPFPYICPKNDSRIFVNVIKHRSLHAGLRTSMCASVKTLSAPEYEVVCNETLESLTDYFDVIVEENLHLVNSDVTYGDGVLTVNFGDPHGTYVINRQTPNKQIWLSSPTSGPKRYDFDVVRNCWIYKHENKSLHDLLQEEIPRIVKSKVDFYENCSHSGKR